jgi:hypothetical protein
LPCFLYLTSSGGKVILQREKASRNRPSIFLMTPPSHEL